MKIYKINVPFRTLKKEYCSECGREMLGVYVGGEEFELKKFDVETGERNIVLAMKCPKDSLFQDIIGNMHDYYPVQGI